MTQRSTAQHSSAPVRRLATCLFMPPRQLEKHEALNRSPCCSAASWALTMASGAALGAGERGSMGKNKLLEYNSKPLQKLFLFLCLYKILKK